MIYEMLKLTCISIWSLCVCHLLNPMHIFLWSTLHLIYICKNLSSCFY